MLRFDKDPIYQVMKLQMQKFVNNVKHKMFILNALPEINRSIVMKIAPMLKNGTDPVVIDVRTSGLHFTGFSMH